MTFRLTTLTPTIGAAPGEVVLGRVEIHNDGQSAAVYTIALVGLDPGDLAETTAAAPIRTSIDPGQSAVVGVPVTVPRALGIGQHAAAFEVTSDRPGDRAVLTPFTLSIASVSRVELSAVPSTIRARRRASLHLDITNNEPQQVEIGLVGEAPDVDVQFTPSALTLLPGQHAVAKGKITGPRHWAGEPTQHNLVVTARGRASSTSITAAYVQRPLFAYRLRMVVAAFTVIALWLAAIGGVAFWLASRDDGTDATADGLIGVDVDGDGVIDVWRDADGNPVEAVDTDGDGIPDMFLDADGNPIPGIDTDGDGIPDKLVDANGDPITAVDTDGDGIADSLSNGAAPSDDDEVAIAPTKPSVLRGTVKIDDDPTKVTITLTPLTLGAAPSPTATPIGFRGTTPSQPEGKIWSARYGVVGGVATDIRRTVAIAPPPTTPGVDGVWLFTDVKQGQNYEVSFASPGYQTQSFVVTPPADGEPIDLDVEMKAAKGSISGTVSGPSGPLGSADITITDGTLEFKTSSDSTTGQWSIDGVSTPGVYTISAALRGYATAVRQVELAPGGKSSGITLQMNPGLGTITGRIVDASGKPAGGVTVTASNGDTTLTSTSLTQGDIGFFSLPQLAVPATYTVRAELDGFIAQSRRVPLNGSASGVDFTMTSETITLTGRVTSADGSGIEGAGLTISTGDLVFRSSTSAAPDAGVFTIDRLPPGTYTVTVAHYQHESATEFLTLTAGVVPPPVNISLPRTTGPPAIGTGSLKVTVFDTNPDADPRFLDSAMVTVRRNRTTDAPRTLEASGQNGVTFENLPIGTYTVTATANGYNSSQPRTRSVGFQGDSVDIDLQQLGDASGTITDSVGVAPVALTGYQVTLHGLNSQFERIPGRDYGPFTAGGNGRWTTPDSPLPTGLFEIEVSRRPPGYYVPQQVVDIAPEVQNRPMTFFIPQVADAAVQTIDIALSATPYQEIKGFVFEPTLTGTAIGWSPLVVPANKVTATCNGTPVALSSSADADNFTIDKSEVGRAITGTSGSCIVTVAADGRIQSQITLTDVGPTAVAATKTRSVAFPQAKQLADLSGTIGWENPAATPKFVPIGGASITASVIPGFDAVETLAPTAPRPQPQPRTNITTTSAAGTGAWSLPGQVFGEATYDLTASNFTPSSVEFTVDQTTRQASDQSNATVTGTDPSYSLVMLGGQPGTATGNVVIQTNKVPPLYATDMVEARRPGQPSAEKTTTPNSSGSFTLTGLTPGSWAVNFLTPANHRLDSLANDPANTKVINPGQNTPGFTATFTELGTIEVTFRDKLSSAVPKATFDPIATFVVTDSTGTVVNGLQTSGPTNGVYTIRGLPVAATNPTTNAVAYRLYPTVESYDLIGSLISPTGLSFDDDGKPYIPLPMRAGDVVETDIAIARMQSIEGRVVGNVEAGQQQPLQLTSAHVQRVDASGAPVTSSDPPPQVTSNSDGTFTVTAAPGFYKITPAHPQFLPITDAGTPLDPRDPAAPPARSYPVGVFEILETGPTELTSPFTLDLRPADLSVRAVADLAGGIDVTGAVYTLTPGTTCAPLGAPPAVMPDTTLPVADLELVPGSYCLRINKYDPVTLADIAFPAVIQLTLPRTTEGVANLTTVIAPLPSLIPSLAGTIVAQNEAGVPIELTATSPELTSVYATDVRVSVNGTLEDNGQPQASASREATATANTDPAILPWAFRFENMAIGTHTITAPDIAGYTLLTAPQNVQVTALGLNTMPDPFIYEADSAAVEFVLPAGTYPTLAQASPPAGTVVVTAPSGTTYGNTFTFSTETNGTHILRVPGVAPEKSNFTLTFDDALHAPVSKNFQFKGPNPVSVDVATTADKVRLTGTVQQRQSSTGPNQLVNLGAGAVMVLDGATDYTLRPDPTVALPNSPGTSLVDATYTMDVAAGTYDLNVTQTGYAPGTFLALDLGSLGSVVTRNVEINKMGRITLSASSALTAPPGLTLKLRNALNVVMTPQSGNTYLVPAGDYTASAEATDYPTQGTSAFNVGIGVGSATPVTVNVPLVRQVRVQVLAPANATVKIGSVTATQDAGSPTIYRFTSPSVSATTALTATVTASGYRAQTVSIPAATSYNDPAPPAITLLGDVTVSGTLPAGATASTSTIKAVESGGSEQPGTVTVTSGVASYEIPGLGAGTWSVVYDEVGVGSATMPLAAAITPTSAVAVTQNIAAADLTRAIVDFNFAVTTPGSPNTPVVGASVTITNAANATLDSDTTPPTAAGPPATTAGQVKLQVGEHLAPTKWTVSHPNFLTRSGTIGPITSRGAQNIPVSLRPALVGTVTDGGTGVAGVTVTLRASAATTCSGTVLDTTTTLAAATGIPVGTFKFNTELAASTSYVVCAVSGTKVGNAAFTTTASGGASLPAAGVIPIATP